MSDREGGCPYRSLPAQAFWRSSVANLPAGDVNPLGVAKFTLKPTDRIATAGSCFAQHIARYLQSSGCQFYDAEPAHPVLDSETAKAFQYGLFSARFGNIYTTRQLLQLFRRAFGQFEPIDRAWSSGGRFTDPYRPSVQPNGFASLVELEADRVQHLVRVRRMFETMDCFVFTLGLTETWENAIDGAVYPVCPGCGYGAFEAGQHLFRNLDVDDVRRDLQEFIAALRDVNPSSRVLLTVSPVPLIATMSGGHVLAATTYSKAVLRVAAESVARDSSHVAYLPSYEIITSASARGRYFATDLRSVTEEGVQHVMRCFFQAYFPGVTPADAAPAAAAASNPLVSTLSAVVSDVVCDEENLDV